MKTTTRWLWVATILAVGAAASAPGGPPIGGGGFPGPGGGPMPPGVPGAEGEPGGGTPTASRKRAVLVLPFINDGPADTNHWRAAFMILFADQPQASYLPLTMRSAPAVLEAFALGRRDPGQRADQLVALEEAGGDTLLVSHYEFAGGAWTIRGEAFEAQPLGEESFAEVSVTAPRPYVALQAYEQAWRAKLGPVQTAGTGPGVGPGLDGSQLPGGVGLEGGLMPPGGTSAGADVGAAGGPPPGGFMPGMQPGLAPENEPGSLMPGAGGGPTAGGGVVYDLDLEPLARALDAWPYGDPAQAWRGNLDDALKYAEEQIAAEPRAGLAHTWAALAHIARGSVERGVALQRAWTEAQDDSAYEQTRLGEVLVAAEQWREAEAAFAEAIDADEYPLVAPLDQAALLGRQRRWSDAVAMLGKLTEEDKSVAAYFQAVGRAELARGRLDESAAAFRQAAATSPGDMATYEGLVEAYARRGASTGMFQAAQAATQELEPDWRAWALMSRVRLLIGELDQAAAAAQKAAELAPQRVGALLPAAGVLIARGDAGSAATVYERALALDPESNAARRGLALAQLYADRLDEAQATILDALRRAAAADLPATCRDAARVAFYRGDTAAGHDYLTLAEQFEPAGAEGQMLRCFLSLYEGQDEAAWTAFSAAVGLGLDPAVVDEAHRVLDGATKERPPKVAAHVMLGVLFERAGQVDEARTQYRTYRAKAGRGFLSDYVAERMDATQRRP